MPEFTGRNREIYRIRVVLERQRQVEHESEGWVNMPGDKPETLNTTLVSVTDKEPEAKAAYKRIVTLPPK